MKIVNLSGGLGNQMFQYAFAVALQHKYPEERVYIDIQHYNTIFFKKFRGVNLHNGYEISKVFKNADLHIAKPWDIIHLSYFIPNYVLSRIARKILPVRASEYVAKYAMNYSYDGNAFENNCSMYYEGYWQCIKYYSNIKDILQKHFSHPTPNEYNSTLIAEIQNSESVGIHVRRGDYLSEPEFRGICDLDYYRKSIDVILREHKNCHFYIFSNDIQWCRTNLLPLVGDSKITFVTENKGCNSCWDMFLMTYCKHLIIANSSFSWWGAFLNNRVEKVCAPYPWINRDCELDIYDDAWIKIK